MEPVKDNKVIRSSEKSTVRLIYICVYIFLSALFLKLLFSQIVNSIFEHDLLWFIPTVAREIEGLSFLELINYFFSPVPLFFESPSLDIYAFSILTFLGPMAKNFIFVSIFFHFCCSILLFLVTKKLGLSSRISFLSALMYLTLFAHFHAYMWPMAFMHLIVVFFILLGLNFYLKTDRLINSGGNYRLNFVLTLLINLIASFCRVSVLILPGMIITHILLCAKDNKDRIKKYNIWLPLFIIYLIYPLFVLIVGDHRIRNLFWSLMPFTANNVPFDINKISIPVKFSILFLLGVASLFIFRAVLVMYQKYKLKKVLKWTMITAVIAVWALLIKLGGARRLLIPYNIIVPFAGILASFLQPLKNALLVNSGSQYYLIPLQLSVFNFLLSFLILGAFVKKFVFKHKQLMILAIFYIGDSIYLYLWNPVTSRYFIYLSPLFCIVFCAVFDYLYTTLTRSIKFNSVTREIILVLIFCSLCIPNVLAIKLALFKGKMVNTFCTYDYARVADAVRQDLIQNNSIKEAREKAIYIDNIVPITFTPKITSTQTRSFSASDPRNDNARFVLMQALNDPSISIEINQTPKGNQGYIIYSLDGYRINNAEGANISRFSHFFEQGLKHLRGNRYTDAENSFSKAIHQRSHLLNYILSNLRLEDLEWVTDGDDMRVWVNKIGSFYSLRDYGSRELERTKYILAIMNREIDEYIQCLFYMSFLKYVSGYAEESKYWFAKIRFLENDYGKLHSWLTQVPLVSSNKRMLAFLDSFDNASLYALHEIYRDRYKFERFLFRLIF